MAGDRSESPLRLGLLGQEAESWLSTSRDPRIERSCSRDGGNTWDIETSHLAPLPPDLLGGQVEGTGELRS